MEKFCNRCKEMGFFSIYPGQAICNDCCHELAGNVPPAKETAYEKYKRELQAYLDSAEYTLEELLTDIESY